MSDPKTTSGHQPARSVGAEEGGHRVTSPSVADAGKPEVTEPPEYGETIESLDTVPSDVEPETERKKPE